MGLEKPGHFVRPYATLLAVLIPGDLMTGNKVIFRRLLPTDPSGPSAELFTFVARRNKGAKPSQETDQIHFFVSDCGVLTRLIGAPGLSGAVACTPSGDVHVALPRRMVHFKKVDGNWVRYKEHPHIVAVFQIRCYQDELVAWNLREMWRFDGESWIVMPIPSHQVYDISWRKTGFLLAACAMGNLFEWEGLQWRKIESPTRWDLLSVQCVTSDHWLLSEQKYYSQEPASIREYSEGYWKVLHQGPDDIQTVAAFQGRVYGNIEGKGVFVLRDGELQPLLPFAKAYALYAGPALMIGTPDGISVSCDGVAFRTITKDEILPLFDVPPK